MDGASGFTHIIRLDVCVASINSLILCILSLLSYSLHIPFASSPSGLFSSSAELLLLLSPHRSSEYLPMNISWTCTHARSIFSCALQHADKLFKCAQHSTA